MDGFRFEHARPANGLSDRGPGVAGKGIEPDALARSGGAIQGFDDTHVRQTFNAGGFSLKTCSRR